MERFKFDNTPTLHPRSVKRVDRDVVTLDYHQDGREAKDTTQEPGKKQNRRPSEGAPEPAQQISLPGQSLVNTQLTRLNNRTA